jgi:hypothetical protein
LRLYFAIQILASLLRSEGASENSPQFQLRVNATKKPSPAGATDKTVAENFAAPPGLADFYRIKPAVETAGCSHPLPRDCCAANPQKIQTRIARIFANSIRVNSRNSRQKYLCSLVSLNFPAFAANCARHENPRP